MIVWWKLNVLHPTHFTQWSLTIGSLVTWKISRENTEYREQTQLIQNMYAESLVPLPPWKEGISVLLLTEPGQYNSPTMDGTWHQPIRLSIKPIRLSIKPIWHNIKHIRKGKNIEIPQLKHFPHTALLQTAVNHSTTLLSFLCFSSISAPYCHYYCDLLFMKDPPLFWFSVMY